jgi:putative metalloprotease
MKKLSVIAMALLLAACNTVPKSGDASAKAAETAAAANAAAAAEAAVEAAAPKVITVSDMELKSLAVKMQTRLDASNPLGERDRYVLRLARLTAKLQNEAGLSLNFKAYRNPVLDATTSPDGSIRVYSGLMDTLNDPELLAMLAREISFVQNGAAMTRLRTAYQAFDGAKSVATFSNALDALSDADLQAIGEQLDKNPYTAAADLEADDYSLAYLKKSHLDPKALERALRKLQLRSQRDKSVALLYPDAKGRADRVRDSLAAKK